MNAETTNRLQGMSQEEKEKRFAKLLQKHNVLDPKALSGQIPDVLSLEEVEEREWLKKDLGYDL